ncbi:MAG TPA: pyridoxal phosphate-dependent aminotransferase [Polyangia bacterium]|nr:pyridoxal phosphate-dependent aminotransferase [Polyangia bacterium]
MFSSRLPPSLAANRISRAVDVARAAAAPLHDLTETNPTAVGLVYPAAAILAALADARALAYEPTAEGLLCARVAVADYYRRHERAVDPAHVTLTASTSEAYAWLLKLLCDPGDDILVPSPSYPLFDHLAALEGVQLRHYPVRYHGGWFIDADEVRRNIGPRTRAVVVVNPNNPTGSFLTRAEAAALAQLAAAHDLAIISDEVFADYAYAPDAARATTLVGAGAATAPALTFCLSGLSKPAGLPQLKLGWIVTGGPLALRARAEERLHLIADTYLSVATPVQLAAPALLPLVDDIGAQIRARAIANRAALAAAFAAGSAAQLYRADGGWSAIVRLPATRTEEEWTLALLARGVIVHPGFFFDLPTTTIVVSLLVAPATLAAALPALAALVDDA